MRNKQGGNGMPGSPTTPIMGWWDAPGVSGAKHHYPPGGKVETFPLIPDFVRYWWKGLSAINLNHIIHIIYYIILYKNI